MEAAMSRHADAPWYKEARATIDEWTERVLATDDPGEVEEMMATVLPFYTAHPDQPEVAAALADMRGHLTVDLAAAQAWEGGVSQTFDLRPLLGKIASPTLVVTGEADFVCGPAQARLIHAGVPDSQLVLIPDCGHLLSAEAPHECRRVVVDFLS
jgi:proline iminopeptidase